MLEYKQIKPEIGKWYVSDTGPITRGPPGQDKFSYPGAHHTIWSGPYETEAEAKAWAIEFEDTERNMKERTYVWQA